MKQILKIIIIFVVIILLLLSIYSLWLTIAKPNPFENVNADNEGIKAGILYLFKTVIRITSILFILIMIILYLIKRQKIILAGFISLLISFLLTYIN